jgi:hypothetical protein
VQLTQAYNTGDTEVHTFTIPGDFLTMTGTTSGQIRVGACPRYNDATGSTETLVLVDSATRASNKLSVTVTRPLDAP